MATEKRRLLTISQAAALLGVSQNTLRVWADKGLVPHIRTPTGYRRFEPEALERFMEEMEAGPRGKAAA